MGLQHGECDEQYHSVRVVIRPQNLPQTQDILERKFALERDEDPTARDFVKKGQVAWRRTVKKGPTGSRRIGSILPSSQSVDITQGP